MNICTNIQIGNRVDTLLPITDSKLIFSTAISSAFKTSVHRFLISLPQDVIELVKINGTRILVVRNVSELEPTLAACQAHKKCNGKFADLLPAFYSGHLNAIVISEHPNLDVQAEEIKCRLAQTRKLLHKLGIRTYGNETIESYISFTKCCAHAFGHALNSALSHFALSPEFDQAFCQDLKNLSEVDQLKLWYFISTDCAITDPQPAYSVAKEELFAELFAVNYVGSDMPGEVDHILKENFATLVNLVQSKIITTLNTCHLDGHKAN